MTDLTHRTAHWTRAWSLGCALAALIASGCGGGLAKVSQPQQCPVGSVPKIVRVKQGSAAAPTEAISDLCGSWIRQGEQGLIEDFEDDNNQLIKADGRSGYWYLHSDPNGSTIEPNPFATVEGGFHGTDYAVNITGVTSAADGAYGSQLGVNFATGAYDASKHIGLRFRAKVGADSARSIRFQVADINTHKDGGVCTDCWNHFGKDISFSTEWEEYIVLFNELRQAPYWGAPRPDAVAADKLWALVWSIGPGKKFDIWLDDVEFIQCQ